jgi:hypothetical protein
MQGEKKSRKHMRQVENNLYCMQSDALAKLASIDLRANAARLMATVKTAARP